MARTVRLGLIGFLFLLSGINLALVFELNNQIFDKTSKVYKAYIDGHMLGCMEGVKNRDVCNPLNQQFKRQMDTLWKDIKKD